MSASKGERERIRRSRYQAIDLRTSHIADGWLHDPSHGQDQSPDEIVGRDRGPKGALDTLECSTDFAAAIRVA